MGNIGNWLRKRKKNKSKGYNFGKSYTKNGSLLIFLLLLSMALHSQTSSAQRRRILGAAANLINKNISQQKEKTQSDKPQEKVSNNSSVSNASSTTNTNKKNSFSYFNPLTDNHIKSPKTLEGMFGMKVFEFERKLKNSYGAVQVSYIFGLLSRMKLLNFYITAFFDKKRTIGKIIIEEEKQGFIGIKAREFFLSLFLDKKKLQNYKITIKQKKIIIEYAK